MDAEYQLPEYLNFKLGSVLPTEFRAYILRGASVLSATSAVGSMVVQTFEQPLFTIRFKFHEFLEPIKIIFHQKSARLISLLALKNSLHYFLEGRGSLMLKQRQFALLECHEQDIIAHYNKGKKYESLEVSWSEEIIKEAGAYFKVQ